MVRGGDNLQITSFLRFITSRSSAPSTYSSNINSNFNSGAISLTQLFFYQNPSGNGKSGSTTNLNAESITEGMNRDKSGQG